jgi:hypothetical protein
VSLFSGEGNVVVRANAGGQSFSATPVEVAYRWREWRGRPMAEQQLANLAQLGDKAQALDLSYARGGVRWCQHVAC